MDAVPLPDGELAAPEPLTEDEVARYVVAAAVWAPSVHNTQPWRFVAHDDVIELWDDPARGLPVLDPVGRARLISCGAALALAEVAAAGLGVSTRTSLLPDAAAPDHLADWQQFRSVIEVG